MIPTTLSLTKPNIMNIAQIKQSITIPEWLQSLGIEPVKASANGLTYHCPWREDRHPSMSVTADGRVWYDHSSGEHGSIIDLAMKMMKTSDLAQVCAAFDTFSPNRSIPYLDQRKEKETASGDGEAFSSFNVVPLRSRGLLSYLSGRGIQEDLAKAYCQEAHYSFGGPDNFYYAVAYPNDKGGYELRNAHFKGGTSPKGITTHLEVYGAPVVVFEGFIDMLSFAMMERRRRHNYCVLNSVVNADAAIERLAAAPSPWVTKVYLCLDNDQAGREATAKMLQQLPMAEDISSRFAPFKDLNDYYISTLNPTQKH